MWPIWTLEEARRADRTAQEQGVPFAALLSVAGFQLARFINHIVPEGPIAILAGPGANGGDGWVAARHLARVRQTTVIPVGHPHFPGADDWVRAARAAGVTISSSSDSALKDSELVVDAMFGTGFHGDVSQSPAGPWLSRLADLGSPVVAVDMPSGIETNTGHYDGPRLNVRATLTMGAAKWGLVTYPGAGHTGTLVVADIGLPWMSDETGAWIGPKTASGWFPAVNRLAHKYDRGHVVVIGGSRSMPGAPILAASAALKAGAGLVEVVVPESAQGRVTTSPALIVHGAPETADGELVWSDKLRDRILRADAVVVGPGLGSRADLRILQELSRIEKPTVVDADGIRLAAPLSRPFPSHWVLTPHAAELGALLNESAATINADRRRHALEAAAVLGCPVLLKGRYSLIADKKHIWVNPTGSAALATAGSGDVLAGMAARLLAAGLKGAEALALAAYWHGWAGELGGDSEGVSFTAADLLGWIGKAARAVVEQRMPAGVQQWL